MTMRLSGESMHTRRQWLTMMRTATGAALLLFSVSTLAVPSFSRQTGRPCSGCHTVFPELTPYGREFKLGGFTAGDKLTKEPSLLKIPLSVSAVLSDTSTRKTSDAPDSFEHDRKVIVQEASIYYGGRIAGNFGALVQYKYHAVDFKWATEMAEIRYANETTLGKEQQLIYGFTTNNNPTIADIYNSTPMWGFPHLASDVAVMPNAAAIVDNALASQVGGVGAYMRWNELVYAEVDVYHKATGVLHPFGAGIQIMNVLDGYAPYWRLALQYETSPQSFEVGTYGMDAKIFPNAAQPVGPTDHFRDIAFDTQYQYIQGNHSLSVHATYIHEKQDWDASFPLGLSSNASSTLRTARADVHYFYRHRLGGSLQYFTTSGDADAIRYNTGDAVNGSLSGKPDTSGWNALATYLPIQNIQLGLQYTIYDKFDGGRGNYSGSGRSASDNNTLFAYLWVLY
jgi:hypothetical protein